MIDAALRSEAYPVAAVRSAAHALRAAALGVLLAVPGGLTVYLAFNSGGMFEVTTAVAGVAILALAAVALALARSPLAGLTPRGMVACGLLGAFALWTILSGRWSGSTGRALAAFDRVLLYLAVLMVFACLERTLTRVRWVLRGLLAAGGLVSVIGLISRLVPSLWHTHPPLIIDRLSYPITYWNTFGFLVAVTAILATHHASDEHEPAWVRISSSALLPLLGATVLLTFSRGAVAVAALGIPLYLVCARPRGVVGALLACAAPVGLALERAYSAVLVQQGPAVTPEALAAAHHLAVWLGGCAVAAGVLRAMTLPLDARLARWAPRRLRVGRVGWAGGAAAAIAILAAAFVVGGGPAFLHRQYESFVNGSQSAYAQRSHLLFAGNDGRIDAWQVAYDQLRSDPLRGGGAGTYELAWDAQRPTAAERVYAYSIYVEVAGELGIVGVALLVGALLVIVVGVAVRVRGPGRAAWAAAFAIVVAWVVHAGVDLDFETPAVSVFVFALGGLALAREHQRTTPVRGSHRWRRPGRWCVLLIEASSRSLRPVLALGAVALAIVPARMALAQTRSAQSVAALDAAHCTAAVASARSSIAALDTGAGPYEVLAMCAARDRKGAAAVAWARLAVAHDPHFWEGHYVLALAEGVAGVDPRPQAAEALAEDRLGQVPQLAVDAFRGRGRRHWRAAALSLPLALGQ